MKKSNKLDNQQMRNVVLGGSLGKMFGKKHRFAVKGPLEAIRALSVNFAGFEQFLNTSKRRGLVYAVFSGKKNLSLEQLSLNGSAEDIRIMPVVVGSKQAGVFQVILGAAMIAAAFFTGGASIAAWGAVSTGLAISGVSMALGGVIQMLSPQAGGLASKQDADNKASYAFGGVTNTTAQGNPVPLLYGKRRIGGAIISAGIYAEDQQ